MLREADDDAVPEVARERTQNTIRIPRGVAEQVILRPMLDQLLSPAVVEEMVAEMRAYYPAVASLASLKAGKPDPAPGELLAIIQRAEAKRTELLSCGARDETAWTKC